jgi:DNA-binding Lrp family transcriptional regulator
MTLTEMSRRTGIPISTVANRVQALQDARVITRHTALLDFRTLGLQDHVLVICTPAAQDDEARRYLARCGFVNRLIVSEREDGLRRLHAELHVPGVRELNIVLQGLRTRRCVIEVGDVLEASVESLACKSRDERADDTSGPAAR